MGRPALLAVQRAPGGSGSARARVLGLVGADVARASRGSGRSTPWLLALVVAGVACALALAALRVEILRTRYELGRLADEEAGLHEARSALLVEVRELRHPERLARIAARRGFAPPERVVQLAEPPEPAPGTRP